MKTSFSLLLVVGVAAGQSPSVLLFGRTAAASWSDPTGANTLYAWWVHTDITNTFVSDPNPWADRVQFRLMRESNSSAYPSNTSLGLEFNGFRYCSNAPIAAGSNSSIAFVFRPSAVANNGLMTIMTSSDNFNGSFAIHSAFTFYNSGYHDFGGTVLASNSYTVALCQSNGTMFCYTNGLLAATLSQTPPSGGWPWRQFASDDTSDTIFKGWLREITVWSNVLTSAQNALYHTYATNTYSP